MNLKKVVKRFCAVSAGIILSGCSMLEISEQESSGGGAGIATERAASTTLTLSSDSLTLGTYTSAFTSGSFKVYATSEKYVRVISSSASLNGMSFSKALDMRGGGVAGSYRALEFTAAANSRVTVYATVDSGRYIALYTSSGTQVSRQGGSGAITSYTFDIDAAGTYDLLSTACAINIYYVLVSPQTDSNYGTSDTFTKYGATIASMYGTSSGLGSLSTSEPSDASGITAAVSVSDVQARLDAFDSEDDLLPKVKVTYNKSTAKWVILYTTDTTVTSSSSYSLASETYTSLIDTVNTAFTYLTSGRSSKEKVLIDASGSSGTAADTQANTISRVNVSNRMAGSISIIPPSYTILDFDDNTIYVDTSGSFSGSQTKSGVTYSFTYNINSFINIERGVHDISVRNGTFTGKPTYGIFIAQGYDIVVDNVKIMAASGETCAANIGIRAQSEATAAPNVALDRWSYNLYFDNIVTDGTVEHGIETFNTYNVYMGTVSVTDASAGCGVLLNCSYNVWINTIKAVRCCSAGTYAAFRCANDVGPNVNVHYVYSEASGHGLFFCSSSNGITVDKVKLLNSMSTGIQVGGSANISVQGGQILSNGGTVTYCSSSGSKGTASANSGVANQLVNGSSSQFLAQHNNFFKNLTVSGYTYAFEERYRMSANYNVYENITYSGCSKGLITYSDKGTCASNDVAGAFNVINGSCGSGNDDLYWITKSNGDYQYQLDADKTGWVLISYTGSASSVSVPSRYSGWDVVGIGDFAFYGNTSLTSVTIPATVKTVGELAFAECTNLASVAFTSGGSYVVDHGAFRDCTSLSSVNLTGVTALRASAFANCTSLTSVACPATLVYFGANCFYNDDVALTIAATSASAMTVEPYAFYFIGRNASIKFTGISAAASVTSFTCVGSSDYYYYSQNYMEQNYYKTGVWGKTWYHVAVAPTF
ncbi:MAG: leucine-rich repeat domain-containing protein [Treponema sp.]|nr:leucine-rich repeat domain-containing protein [Treponema sp.]